MRIEHFLRVIALLLLAACQGGGLPRGWQPTPEGFGPVVRWDLDAEPLPEIPLPNDVATWADPTSPNGLRLNASLLVPTNLESSTRRHLNELDGWGTFAPLSVSFEGPISTADLFSRQGGSDHFGADSWTRHAIYLIDLTTGIPVPLDVNSGSFPYAVERPDQYFDNDPRAGELNTLFETVDEDTNGNGMLDAGEDTDFDGVLDKPNTFSGELGTDATDTLDRMMWFYERETDTLILRPMVPMHANRAYAVVLTDRLRGASAGEPVRSPFPDVHHISQTGALASLPDHFRDHPELYGDLAARGWEGVAFAWTFTTQSVRQDLDTIREGLYGRGTMARLATEFPPDVLLHPMQGGAACPDPGAGLYIAPGDRFTAALRQLATLGLGLTDEQAANMIATYDNLDHVAVAFFESPYFLGDPDQPSLEETFDMDWQTGRARVTSELLSALIFVPKESAGHTQPFPATFYVHGHGSASAEALPWAGMLTRQHMALVLMNAQGHGLALDLLLQAALDATFGDACLRPTSQAFAAGRARDLDGDGDLDSGSNFWTAYAFHTRDVVRQTIVDHVRAVQILRSFDGVRRYAPMAREIPGRRTTTVDFSGDLDGDGTADIAGDFDGDGVVDVGGPDQRFAFMGGSLGGIVSGVMAGVEPRVTAAAPIVGAGGLADVAVRTNNGAVLAAMILRIMGPMVVGMPSTGPDDRTSCPAGNISLRFLVPTLSSQARIEFACLDGAALGDDDVLVVRNLSNDEVNCSGTTGGPGRFRVSVPADGGDRFWIELYLGARNRTDFGLCSVASPSVPDRVIDTWEVGNGTPTAERPNQCADCAAYQRTTWEIGDRLVAPAPGFGRARQTPDFRRLVMLAQIALERADPINYARRVFLEPFEGPDAPTTARSVLVVTTVGDNNVVLATAHHYARAAGILPFLPADAPDAFAEMRAPASFAGRYPGIATPNDVLIAYHVNEGVSPLNRHPVMGADFFLVDVDDVSDGRIQFELDGSQSSAPTAIQPPRVSPPLRWVRASRPMTSPSDDVWTIAPGEGLSGLINVYSVPEGRHGFDSSTFMVSGVPFDVTQYTINLLGRYAASAGTDIRYITDPAGHHCLETSSCVF